MYIFLEKFKIRSTDLLDVTKDYLIRKYNQVSESFTYASSFGQILLVIHNITQILFLYIKDSVQESNIRTAKRNNSIYGAAQLNGHNPSRGRSAVGEISVRLKSGANINSLKGNLVYIANYTRIKCLNNELSYLMLLGRDDIIINISDNKAINIRITEGEIDYQIFTGTGQGLQSFEAASQPNTYVDDDFVQVYVNGEKFDRYESLYDMPYMAKGYLLKTGITSGIDVIFGQPHSVTIPKLGEEIRVDYLSINGSAGNVLDKINTGFEFTDTGFNILGEEIDLNEIFEITVNIPLMFGADPEPAELTKLLAPNISKNFVIHDKKSIEYVIHKMNYFKTIKVIKTDTNQYDIHLVPKFSNRLMPGEDYFSMDESKFSITEDEKNMLFNYMYESQTLSSNIDIRIPEQTVRKFAMHIIIDAYNEIDGHTTTDLDLKKEIRSTFSNFLINNNRINKLPHSDIVKTLDNIQFIDTVKVVFKSPDISYLDNIGNISLPENEMAIIRGGWTDQDGIFYENIYDPETDVTGSVNIQINYINA